MAIRSYSGGLTVSLAPGEAIDIKDRVTGNIVARLSINAGTGEGDVAIVGNLENPVEVS